MTISITDPKLLERLNLADDDFVPYFVELISHFPAREFTLEAFEHGLRYPWTRPERSYLLRDGVVTLLHGLEPEQRLAVLDRHRDPAAQRVALLAFGSNVAPKNLAVKLAHHAAPEDREVLVLAGDLGDLDVVACAAVAGYGAMAATLASSPGTRVRAAVMFVNATQLTTLAWGEMPYRVGRLHGARFTLEDEVEGPALDGPLAFVSRWGAFAPDGEPIALAAIPAQGRTMQAWTQRELLDRVAAMLLTADSDGEALMRLLYAGFSSAAERLLPAMRPYALPFDFPGWTPMSQDGTFADGPIQPMTPAA